MRIIKPTTLKSYWARHRDARPSLEDWLNEARAAKWQNLTEARRTYPSADAATGASGATLTIFNIKGNHYRLITAIHYDRQRIFIRDFMTHAEYSKNRWKDRH